MKKVFTILVTLLLAVTVNAAERTATYIFTSKSWAATLNSESANWVSGNDGASFASYGVLVNTMASGANATSPVAFDNISRIVITYNTLKSVGEGTFGVKIGSNAVVSKPWQFTEMLDEDEMAIDGRFANFTTQYDYATPQSGKVTLQVNTTTNSIYVVSIAITYTYETALPEIHAERVDLGTSIIGIGASGYAKDTNLVVEGANLSNPIAVSFIGTHLSATESELPAAGGTLHLHAASTEAMMLADTVVLTSGTTVAKVPVVGKIKKNIALPGVAVTMNSGERCESVTVDNISAIKVGNPSVGGNMTISLPAETGKLRFYAAAWSALPGTITISAPAGVTLSNTSFTLLADAGITGTSPFTLDALTPTVYACELSLSGVTEPMNITIASGTLKRFVIWGAKCDIGAGESVPTDCTIKYKNKVGTVFASEVLTFNLPEAPVVAGFTFLYWKAVEGNIADGINIQAVYQADEPTEAPAVVVDPANPSQKLIREGNVYILHGDQQYNLLGTRIR